MILDGLLGTPTAIFFSITITLVFAIVLIACLSAGTPEKRAWIIAKAPGILTSLGLFGTFWGVAVGLGGFNSRNIDASIPVLLDGLKLAFWTSILGMFYAELINIVHYIAKAFLVHEEKPHDPAQNIYSAVNEAVNSLKASAQAQASHIEGVTRTLEALLRQAAKDAGGIIGENGAVEFKDLKQRSLELTESLKSSLDTSAQTIGEASQVLREQLEAVKSAADSVKLIAKEQATLLLNLHNMNSKLIDDFAKTTDDQTKHLKNITLNLENILRNGAQNVESTFNQTSAAICKSVGKFMEQLDSNTQVILNETLQTMANSLASIDAKMIEDIETITKRLESLSEAAKKGDSNEQRQ